MNKTAVKVLIIDNDRERDGTYRDFIAKVSAHEKSSYAITPLLPESPADALAILRSREPCLVVLDMVLEAEWLDNAELIYSCIRSQGYPIALLSSNFNEANADHTSMKVLMELSTIPKLGFLPYVASIRKHCVDSVGNKITDVLPADTVVVWNFMIAEALGHGTGWQPRLAGELSLLHITDTHFGNNITPDYLNVVSMENGTKMKWFPESQASLCADYVIWTGDITEHGYPNEFDLAFQFAQDLLKASFVAKPCLFSVTPGNHDFCRPLALSSRLEMQETPRDGKVAARKSSSTAPPSLPTANGMSQTLLLLPSYGVSVSRHIGSFIQT